jgi:tRNA U34 5-carboxymethylaminomethyl modifying GTPase MnmE/TrmE
LIDPATGELLDQGLVCYFKAPHSFTGEDVVELHCHGSPILLRSIIDAASGWALVWLILVNSLCVRSPTTLEVNRS